MVTKSDPIVVAFVGQTGEGYGMDISAGMVNVTKRRLEEAGLGAASASISRPYSSLVGSFCGLPRLRLAALFSPTQK